MAYTPGPWIAERDGGMLYLRNGDHTVVALLADDGRAIPSGLEGNDDDARLLAAAPDLLEAAKAMEYCWNELNMAASDAAADLGVKCLDRLIAAIAKAEGRK